MLPPGLDAGNFCTQVVQNVIDDGGLIWHRVTVFYSGPSHELRKRLRKNIRSNWKRAHEQVTRLKAGWLDDTKADKFLRAADLKNYFGGFYGSDTDAVVDAETAVWGYVSERLASGKFREAKTNVCAADPERVFRVYEQPALMRNPHVKKINRYPIQMFRDFTAINPYEAYRLICITELFEARRYAQRKGTKKAWQDYRMRRKCFLEDRHDMLAVISKMPDADRAEIKRQKREALAVYGHVRPRRVILTATTYRRHHRRKPAAPKAA